MADPGAAPQFGVLGPLEVRSEGVVVEIGSAMQRALLARLLVDAGRVISVDRLVDDIWDGRPPASATATLHTYVSQLRRILEPGRAPRSASTVLLTRPPGYALQLAEGALDAQRFATGVDAGRVLLDGGDPAEAVDVLDGALSLWRGHPYADVTLDAVAGERRRLDDMRTMAVEDRFAALLDLGRHRDVLADLEAHVAANPYRERGWELLVTALYRAGRQVEALRAHQRARRSLVEDAGVEPGPRLIDLERRVIAQDPSIDWRPARAGPPRVEDHGPGRSARQRPPLVGRDDALGQFELVLARTAGGRGGILLVGGEAGIGKTRLVEEATDPAGRDGIRTVWGRSTDGDGAPGYWPWTQALGRLAAGAGDAVLDATDPHLVHVLPELAGRLAHQGEPPHRDDDPGAVRFSVQRAVVRFLDAGCASSPTVIVLDDLHWADGSSLRLLGAVAPELARMPLLIVGTYRPAEAHLNGAFTETLAQIARQAEIDRVDLGGLDRAAVATHLAASGVSASPRLVAETHDRSGGNPFFLTELTRLIASQRSATGEPVDGGAAARVPHAVHDVTRQLLARMPSATADLLSLAAVAGRSSDIQVLAHVTDAGIDDVLDRLEPALLSGLVVLDPERPGTVLFAHDLQREAIHEAVPPSARVRFHHQVGSAMVARIRPGDTTAAHEIAHHFAEAMALGTAGDVLHWAELAAAHASARGADDEAVEALTLAVRAHAAARPDDLAGRYHLVVALALAKRSAWDLAGARQAIDTAIALAEQLDDPVLVLDAASITGAVTLWNWSPPGEVPADLVEPMERALERLGPEAGVTRIRGLAALGVALRYEAGSDRARTLTEEAVRCAEEQGDPRELARALNNAFLARWWRPHHDELLAIADRILALDGLTAETEAVARMHRMLILTTRGALGDLAIDIARAEELRDQVRLPDVAAQLDLNCSTWAAMHARPDEARQLLERAYRTHYQDSTMWAGDLVYYLGRTGIGDMSDTEVDAAAGRLAALAADEATDLVRPTAVLALIRAQRHREARLLAGDGPRLCECWTWEFNLVQWAEITVELDLGDGAELARALRPYADDLAVAGSNLACFGSVHQWLGRLAHHVGDAAAAATHIDAAVEQHERLGLPVLAERSRRLRHSLGIAPASA